MENASKALMMAAGVLIGIMILTLAVYLFTSFGSASAEAHRQNAANQINQFNAQFTAYEGRTDVTIHDIVTIANLAKSSNDSYELSGPSLDSNGNNTNYYITVNAQTATGWKYNLQNYKNSDLENLIQYDLVNLVEYPGENSESVPTPGLRTYTCNVEISQNTERVSTVTFRNNN